MQKTRFSTNSYPNESTIAQNHPPQVSLTPNTVKLKNNENIRSSFIEKERVSFSTNTPNTVNIHNSTSNDDNTGGTEMISKRISILKRRSASFNDTKKLRRDTFGNQIKMKGKNHQISFSENLVHVTEVENWKKFNVDNGENTSDSGGCCNVF